MRTHRRYRVMTAYQAKHENPIRFESGELITLGGRDAEFPEFLWATDEKGREGWVHQSKFLGTSEKKAVTTAPYNAIELNVRNGELVTAEEMLGDWSWCSNTEGTQGWLPNHVLEPVTEVLPFSIRPIEAKDDAVIADIIRNVMPEFGAIGDGFAINDPEVDWMTRAYSENRSAYFVVVMNGVVKGGGGVAPLLGGDPDTCELRKMYFLPECRGLGAGSALIAKCLNAARKHDFKRCYLETLDSMKEAQKLYERSGFQKQCGSLGDTGHGGCDTFYLLEL
ncbi:MAG: GNAT family N-acetyltransferase [Arenimonas sp.]